MNVSWLKYRKNLRGRDPLGVQAINIHLYSVLIPGITNVTDRLRYYSFFPWVLKTYKDENIKLDFVPFLRRAEFLFSIITNYHHRDQVGWSGHMVGTMVMGQVFSDLNENKKIALSKYTGLEEGGQRYFKNRLGGFGQYYLGVLVAMAILKRKEELEFSLYPRGSDLAAAFQVGGSKDQFLSCIVNDKVTAKDLETLQNDFCACNLKRSSGEYKLLADYLKGQDDPYAQEQQSTFRRRDSLALMFTLLKQIGATASYWDLLNFLFYGISKNGKEVKIPESLRDTADLWKYYMQHEYFSIALLSLFVSTQHTLDDRGLNRLEIGKTLWDRCVINCEADNLQEGLKKCLLKLKKNPTLADFLEYLDTVYDVDKAWDSSAISEYSICEFVYGKQFPADSLLMGGLVLLCLVLRSDIIKNGEPAGVNFKSFFSQYPINLARLRIDYDSKWKTMRIMDILGDVVMEYILEHHIEVAIRKLYTEGLATFRILREDNVYRHSEMEYDYVGTTSPRLNETLQMMSDLKIIDESKNGFIISDESIGSKYFGDLISGS